MIDYHIHTKLCGHAQGEMEEYVEKAIELNLQEIGFSDHLPLLHIKNPTLSMSEKELPLYVKKVHYLQKKYTQIKIKLGIEVDFIPEKKDEIQKLINQYDFDYVYGSVHFVKDFMIDHPDHANRFKTENILNIYQNYFHTIQEAAKSHLFDIIAHIDVIKKFNYRPCEDITKLLEETIHILKKNNIIIEMNTSGLRKPCQEIYPDFNLLKICQEKKVNITLGSDAHKKEEVGFAFDEAINLLKKAGYKKLATFEKRKIKLISLK
ncbi:MAG: histidinol-phosphatase HisJ [bacterium]